MASRERGSFVWGGRERLRSEEWYRREARKIREDVNRKYEAELEEADRLGKVLVHWKMWREARRKIEALAPEHASYLEAKGSIRRQ